MHQQIIKLGIANTRVCIVTTMKNVPEGFFGSGQEGQGETFLLASGLLKRTAGRCPGKEHRCSSRVHECAGDVEDFQPSVRDGDRRCGIIHWREGLAGLDIRLSVWVGAPERLML